MPYVSSAQRGYFHANRAKLEAQGVNVSEWDSASKGMKLPARAKASGGAVDSALRITRKYAEGGAEPSLQDDEWADVPRSPEGRPQITVTPQQHDGDNPFEAVARKPLQKVAPRENYGSGLATVGHAIGDDLYRQASLFPRMWEEAKRPYMMEGEQTDADPTAGDVTGEAVGTMALNMAGPSAPSGAIREGSLAAAARSMPRVVTSPSAAQARDKVMLGYMDSSTVRPEVMARHLATANKNNPADMADDLYRLWKTDPEYGDGVLKNIPADARGKVDHFLDQQIRASDEALHHPPDYEAAFHDLPIEQHDYVPLDLPKEQTQWAVTNKDILPSSGISERVGDFLSGYVLPHYDSNFKSFTDKYFGGMYNPSKAEFRSVGNNGIGMHTQLADPATGAPLLVEHPADGRLIPATMDRSIIRDPETGLQYAYHGYFSIPKNKQGVGIAKSLLRDQIDLYKKMDLDYVKLTANIDVGSYAWGKYGFLPHTDESWQSLALYLKRGLTQLSSMGRMPGAVSRDLQTILSDPSRQALWDFVDYPSKIPIGILGSRVTRPLKWSQKLILDTPWEGRLDLKDPDSMRKFYDYANKGQ